MHGSWSHILGNMVFLWAFGPQIEDAMNPRRYASFYLAGGNVAMLAQIAADPASKIPCLGASGAIAAVMGAFLVTYPRDKIRTVLFFGWFAKITFIPAAALIGLSFTCSAFQHWRSRRCTGGRRGLSGARRWHGLWGRDSASVRRSAPPRRTIVRRLMAPRSRPWLRRGFQVRLMNIRLLGVIAIASVIDDGRRTRTL